MACLGRSAAALQPHTHPQTAPIAAKARLGVNRCSAGLAAASRPIGGGWAAAGNKHGSRLQAAPKQRLGRPLTRVPDINAEQLLRSLGLDGAADPAALYDNLRKLPGVRQQGVLDSATAVTAHLLSPSVGLTAQQAGQLLERCPYLFSWPPEQRAAVLFGELMAVGLTAAEAAACLLSSTAAVECTTLAPGLAELAAILVHSEDREGGPGRPASVPAAQRMVAALLSQSPSAVRAVCTRAGYLQQRAAELQQAGHTAAQVAAMAWTHPLLLTYKTAAMMANAAAILQQELGLTAAQVESFSARRPPRWLTASRETLRARAAALAQAFGREAVVSALLQQPDLLGCPPAVWRRNLCYMAACGVADPKPVLLRAPSLLYKDHAATSFLQRRLLLQQAFGLTAAQLYEGHTHRLACMEPPRLAQRLQFVEHRGQAHRLVAKGARWSKPAAASAEEWRPALSLVAVTGALERFLPAVGASQAEWEAWVAANPPEACTLYRWAQQAAAEEATRLAAALPPELQPAASGEDGGADIWAAEVQG